MAVAPLWRAGLAAEAAPVSIFAITGSSGAGVTPTPTTHHPRRASAFFAYSIEGHRHLPEIEESLSAIGAPAAGRIVFQTHSAPLVRGIFVTAAVPLKSPMDKAALRDVFRKAYEHEFFVRLTEGSPDVAAVKGTNFADIGFTPSGDGGVAKIFVAIDNLVKGAAGQAIQAMNILFGLPEPTGLKMTGVFP
jgi:N-acetyl-gamma-glutamyl-phosphate reductase common form